MEEIWKDVKGYEGRYKISSLGRVLSTGNYIDGRKYKPKYVSTRNDVGGYVTVGLYKGRIGKTYKVHRLVAEAFIPNPNTLPYVDHINTKRKDNRVENLRWVSHVENCNNELTRKHIKDSAKKAFNKPNVRRERSERMKRINDIVVAKRRKPVLQYDLNGNFIAEHISINKAANSVNGWSCFIRSVCNGETKQYKGYIWAFKDLNI